MMKTNPKKVGKLVIFCILMITYIAVSGCIMGPEAKTSGGESGIEDLRDRSLVVNDIDQSKHYKGTRSECRGHFKRTENTWFKQSIDENVGNSDATLYIILGVHSCSNKLLDDQEKFERSSRNMKRIQDILSNYGGKVSMQVSRKYADWALQLNDYSLKYLADHGSEIALHIHTGYLIPDYLGMEYPGVQKGSEIASKQSKDIWVDALGELKKVVERLSGANVTGISGGQDCEYLEGILTELDMKEVFGYKNKSTHRSDERLLVLNPWKPAGLGSAEELAKYDRNGDVIFMPSGVQPAHCRDIATMPIPFTYGSFDYVTMMLKESLKEVDEDKINVFSVVFHPWDFKEFKDFKIWKEWLDTIIQPFIQDGKVEFATYHEIAEMYENWEEQNIK